MPYLIEARCKKCGRLLFKFATGTFGFIEVKCVRGGCRTINEFQVDARTRQWATAST